MKNGVRITVLLIVAVGALVSVSTGIALFLSGKAAFRSTFELLSNTATLIIQQLEDDVRAHIAPAERIVRHFAALSEAGDIDLSNGDELITALKGAIGTAPQIAGIVYRQADGTGLAVIRAPDGTINAVRDAAPPDARLRGFIEAAKRAGGIHWQEPSFRFGATYINIAAPLHAGGVFRGVLAAGVSVSEMSSFVEHTGAQLKLTAFILYGNDRVLAHPELKSIDPATFSEDRPLLTIAASDDPVLRQFPETAPATGHRVETATVRRIEIDGIRHLAMSRALGGLGDTEWHVGAHAPLDTLDDQVRRLVGAMIAGLAVLIVAIVCAVFLARYIARPIRRIAAVAEGVGRFELTDIAPLERSRIKELDDQATAFNRMLDGLRWFETYVPKSLVTRLIAGHADGEVLSGERRVTVMFTDIVGFTAMTETMPPADVASMLNAHFEIVGRCIEAEGGTLDKFIGDAAMAFWGAPEQQPDHAARACRAAVAIARAVADAAAEPGAHPPIRLKIAIHTGRLLVGNIGAPRRMNYTVIGDTVNTCSRIETLCSQFDDGRLSTVLVSGDTLEEARTEIGDAHEDAGAFSVKGRKEKVRVYRLTGIQP